MLNSVMLNNMSVAVAAAVPRDHKKFGLLRKQSLFCVALFAMMLALTTLSAQAQTFVVLHQFDSAADGAFPVGSVVRDAKGNIFGTTTDPGVIFKIDRRGNESIFALINGADLGIFPSGSLTQDSAGNIYGVAEGGRGGAGTVYKLSPKGIGTVLFSFQGGLTNTDPKGPVGGVLLGANGDIFGAAEVGNSQACDLGCGSIFRLDSSNQLHSLYEFTGEADGSNPTGPLVQDSEGNLYGVAQSGGDHLCKEFFFTRKKGCGVVFKIDSDNVLTVLHTFTGKKGDGAIPRGGLLLDAAGNLFGTTRQGGISDNGTIYRIARDGSYSVLHRFVPAEGQRPNGGLVADPAGILYGTAELGGDQNNGTAFELTPDGTLKLLHNFEGLEDGAFPQAGLFRDQSGNLYGTTHTNGLIQFVQGGNVFKITP